MHTRLVAAAAHQLPFPIATHIIGERDAPARYFVAKNAFAELSSDSTSAGVRPVLVIASHHVSY